MKVTLERPKANSKREEKTKDKKHFGHSRDTSKTEQNTITPKPDTITVIDDATKDKSEITVSVAPVVSERDSERTQDVEFTEIAEPEESKEDIAASPEAPVVEEQDLKVSPEQHSVVVEPLPVERPVRRQGEGDETFAARIRTFYRKRWAAVSFEDITQEEVAYLEKLGGEKNTFLFATAEELAEYRDEVNPFNPKKSSKVKNVLPLLLTLLMSAVALIGSNYLVAALIAKNIASIGG